MTDDEYLIKLGENIAKKRLEAGFNQSQFALRCDMERQNLRRIEKGTKNVQALTLRRLARELGIEVWELVKF